MSRVSSRTARRLKRASVCIWIAYLTLTLAGSSAHGDPVLDAVEKVSQGQYRMYQVDIENMGLGLYGGPSYDQNCRNRDGWANGGTLGNLAARLYLVDQLSSLGLDASIQGVYGNVVAELPGVQAPQRIYIVCGHYDTTSRGEYPGGDDNASGTAGVLEAARVLTQYRFESTLRFIAFNAEEEWMKGSQEYVDALTKDENILGVINLDMILRPAWDNNPRQAVDLEVETRKLSNCMAWVDTFVGAAALYVPSLVIDPASHYPPDWDAGDHGPFIYAGYPALVAIENSAEEIWWDQSNAYYHTPEDASDALANDPHSPSGVTYDYEFATNVVKATVATLATQAVPVWQCGPNLYEAQALATAGAQDLEFFTMENDHYLAVANEMNDVTHDVNSTLYKWDGTGFVQYQSIPTMGASDWEFFTIGDDYYLAVANNRSDVTHNIDSKVFRWDGSAFVEYQSIPTNGANDWRFFTIAGVPYLGVANEHNDVTSLTDSKIYQWNGTSFVEFQSLPTSGVSHLAFFTLGDDSYLAVANMYNDQTYNVESKIYKWGATGFAEFQSLPTHGAADWEFFRIEGDAYLAVANNYDGSTHNVDSKIYKWNGTGFSPLQFIPTSGAVDWEFFTVDGDSFLAVANTADDSTRDVRSRIYRWNGARFVEFACVDSHGAGGWEAFSLEGKQYLGMANAWHGATCSIDSILYRYSGLRSDDLDNGGL